MPREVNFNVENRAQTITETEYRNLQGLLHHVDQNKTVADGGELDITLTTGDKPVMLLLDVSSTGAFTYELYEDQGSMDIQDDGTAIDVKNLNRVKQAGHSTTWQRNPTVNNTGVELIQLKSDGTAGKPGNNDSVPGAANGDVKRILAPNTQYLFRVSDRTTDNNDDVITFNANFWETDYNLSKDNL